MMIQCKDCRYWQTVEQEFGLCELHSYYDETNSTPYGWFPDEYSFCSCAERKDGTHED